MKSILLTTSLFLSFLTNANDNTIICESDPVGLYPEEVHLELDKKNQVQALRYHTYQLETLDFSKEEKTSTFEYTEENLIVSYEAKPSLNLKKVTMRIFYKHDNNETISTNDFICDLK